jgi:alpha-L-fucosidase
MALRSFSSTLAVALAMALGGSVESSSAQQPTATESSPQEAPSWEELRAHPYPEWFRDAKLGIFIHWGVYSVPAYSGLEQYAEWFLRGLQEEDTLRVRFMAEHFGEDFRYRDFAPLFKADLFDADEWADLFRRAGARYVVLVSKHHDGFALWPSAYAEGWNSVDVGPERNLVGELTFAVRRAGLRMGLYYSLAEWNNPLHRWYTDLPESIGPYVDQHMIPQLKELISQYKPSLLFSDGEWLNTAEQWHARELIAWYFDTVGPDAVVNNRWGAGSDIGFLTPEYSSGIESPDRPWAEVRGLGRSFGLNRNEPLESYLGPEELVRRFATAVAAGGGMILNVGPKADGQIPLIQQERLLQLGQWLDLNWQAIYASRPWIRSGEDREVTLERVDPKIDFDWVRNTPGAPIKEDDFNVTWTGYIQTEFTESHTFEAEADDGIRVWVNDRLILDQWGDGTEPLEVSPLTPADGSIRLAAGRKYPIRVEYREGRQNASVHLYWRSPSRAEREIIPTSALFTSSRLSLGNGLNAVYRSMERYLAYTQREGDLFAVFFDWPEAELRLPIPPPSEGQKLRILGLERELSWRTDGEAVYVDLSPIPFSEIRGQWAWTVVLDGYLDSTESGGPKGPP